MKKISLFTSTLIKHIVPIAIWGLLLNLIWEYLHMSLYVHNQLFSTVSGVVFFIQALAGDVLIVILAYILCSIIFSSFKWYSSFKIKYFAVLEIYALFVSVIVEILALSADRWQYSADMPTIYVLGHSVGITPILQLIIIIPVAIYNKKLISFINSPFEN